MKGQSVSFTGFASVGDQNGAEVMALKEGLDILKTQFINCHLYFKNLMLKGYLKRSMEIPYKNKRYTIITTR